MSSMTDQVRNNDTDGRMFCLMGPANIKHYF
jgi:hypothetical protein